MHSTIVAVSSKALSNDTTTGSCVDCSAPQCCHCGYRGTHSPNCPFRWRDHLDLSYVCCEAASLVRVHQFNSSSTVLQYHHHRSCSPHTYFIIYLHQLRCSNNTCYDRSMLSSRRVHYRVRHFDIYLLRRWGGWDLVCVCGRGGGLWSRLMNWFSVYIYIYLLPIFWFLCNTSSCVDVQLISTT